jgi:hypothetical protein
VIAVAGRGDDRPWPDHASLERCLRQEGQYRDDAIDGAAFIVGGFFAHLLNLAAVLAARVNRTFRDRASEPFPLQANRDQRKDHRL